MIFAFLFYNFFSRPLPDEKKIVTDEIAAHERMNNKVEEVLREE